MNWPAGNLHVGVGRSLNPEQVREMLHALRQFTLDAAMIPQGSSDGIDREWHGHFFEAQLGRKCRNVLARALVVCKGLKQRVGETCAVLPGQAKDLDKGAMQRPHHNHAAGDFIARKPSPGSEVRRQPLVSRDGDGLRDTLRDMEVLFEGEQGGKHGRSANALGLRVLQDGINNL